MAEQMMANMVQEVCNLQTMMDAQSEHFHQFFINIQNKNYVLCTRVEELQHQNTQPSAQPIVQRARPKHPNPEYFSGENSKDYHLFCMNLHIKFQVDAAVYTSEKEKAYYAYSRLRGKASQCILPWLQAKQDTNQDITLDDFLAATDKAFRDPNAVQEALVHVNTMKQGRMNLKEFLDELDEALLNAGGLNRDDCQKKALLDTVINVQLLDCLIGHDNPGMYKDYCNQLHWINHDIQQVDHTGCHGQGYSQTSQMTSSQQTDPNKMDWEPMHARFAAL